MFFLTEAMDSLVVVPGPHYSLNPIRPENAPDEWEACALRAAAKHTADWESRFGPDVPLLWVHPAVERIAGFSVAECLATHCLTGR